MFEHIKIWFKRVLFALLCLSICRVFFIVYLNAYFNGAPLSNLPLVFLAGIIFDIQALVYFLALFHLFSLLPLEIQSKKWYQLGLKISFIVGLGVVILLNFIDTEFYQIKTRRSGIELFYLVTDKSNPVGSYFIHYWWLVLVYIAFIIGILFLYPKNKHLFRFGHSIKTFAFTLVILFALFIGARGGFYKKPLRSFDAARFVDPQWVSATINSATQIITSYSANTPSKLTYMNSIDAQGIFNPVQQYVPYFNAKIKPNVVLIIVESLGADYCGFLSKRPRFTPFLDSLAKKSIYFTNAYSSGTTSIESVPAIFASIPSLLEVPYINSNFQNNTIKGVHYYLDKNGYDCSFYYGAENGSMGFDNFLKISGPISYVGLNEYPSKVSDYDGSWGIFDEPYLKYFAQELSKRKTPFFSSVFTLTSHDPYTIPGEYKNKFKGGELPIHKAVEYTDYALNQFFETAKKQPWFSNTVFIITGDHPSHSTNEYYYTPSGKFEVPLMLYAPTLLAPKVVDSFNVSHCDIFPTIMQLTGSKNKFFTMGKSVFETGNRSAINHDVGITQLINYPYCVRLMPNGKFKMHYHQKFIPNKQIRYVFTNEERQLQIKLENELKAKKQIFINNLLENTYFVE